MGVPRGAPGVAYGPFGGADPDGPVRGVEHGGHLLTGGEQVRREVGVSGVQDQGQGPAGADSCGEPPVQRLRAGPGRCMNWAETRS